ncbi:MAG: hypothetical protein P1U69_03725 [Parvibaculaceae bacterium]|nr:hypothetical protein [Parvibaculaceae bacterium]
MTKIPVAQIAADSLKFPIMNVRALARRTGAALGILVIGVGAIIMTTFFSVGGESSESEIATAIFLSVPVIAVVFFVGQSMLANGALQVVLDHPLGKTWFSFGERELRFLLFVPFSFGLLSAAGLVFAIVAALLTMITGGSSALSGDDANPLWFVIAGVGCFLFFFYLIVRLLPLYGFIAIENRFAVVDAWNLSKGHFWRMLGTVLLVGLAASLISGVVNSAMPPTVFLSIMDVEGLPDVPGMPAEQPMAVQILQFLIFACVQTAVLVYSIFANFAAYGLIFKALREGTTPEVAAPANRLVD